ncbi:MAG: FAD-dependent oxidoreductase [Ruminococcaceae bacterium]|nr:FAD-dependent oxidoreductase [Oscillospiraceae bacterium]
MNITITPKRAKEYDVVVCGGGTAGVAAALAAARQGVSVLILERSFFIGGMLTEGNAGITKFTEHFKDAVEYKKKVIDVLATDPKKVQVVGGIAHELCMKLINAGEATGTNGDCGSYIFTNRYAAQIAILDMLEEAKVDVLYDTRVCCVQKDGDVLKSVIAVNKDGFVEFPAKCFIDTTGDADVATLSGAEVAVGAGPTDIAEGGDLTAGHMQPMGVMYRVANVDYETLFAYLDENPEAYFPQILAMMSYEDAKDSYKKGDMVVLGLRMKNVDPKTAEKEPIVDVQVYITPTKSEAILLCCGSSDNFYEGNGVDAATLTQAQNHILRGTQASTDAIRKSFPGFDKAIISHVPIVGVRESRRIIGDYVMSITDVLSGKNFDDSIACGGHPVDTDGVPDEVREAAMQHWRCHIPYRVLLPKNVSQLLVAGRCVSATRLACGTLRTTATCMAMGEAAGVAAAMAVKACTAPSAIDVQQLRKILLDNGAIF